MKARSSASRQGNLRLTRYLPRDRIVRISLNLVGKGDGGGYWWTREQAQDSNRLEASDQGSENG